MLFCNIGQCPKGCLCIEDSFDCSQANMTSMPDDSSGLKYFIGPENMILPTLKMFARLQKLILLDLRSNGIYTLPIGTAAAFQEQNILHTLDLSENNISFIGSLTFTGLSSLQILSLRQNQLQTLHESTFQGLHTIEYLTLDHTFLEALPQAIFQNLTELEHLNLSFNNISTIW